MIKGKNIVDLETMSVAELTSLIHSAEDKRREKIGDARRDLIEEMKARAGEIGLSFHDLMDQPEVQKKEQGVKGKARIQYRGPEGEPWSGRGKPPRWLSALEKAGHHRDEFRVDAPQLPSSE